GLRARHGNARGRRAHVVRGARAGAGTRRAGARGRRRSRGFAPVRRPRPDHGVARRQSPLRARERPGAPEMRPGRKGLEPVPARAASAGVFITMAAHVAAMAPATNIGAASPVALGGGADKTMMKKVENDAAAFIRTIALERGRNADWAEKAVRDAVAITEREALKLKVIDLIADSVPDLLEKIDGRTIKLPKGT